MGHSVTIAENGSIALHISEKQEFDLIFMDMQMPIMGGLEASEKLRGRGVQTPIIALTANSFESDRIACQSAGMNDFSSKPLQKEHIKNLIEKYTSKSSNLNNIKVLLVEDDKLTAEILKILIHTNFPHFSLKTAASGVEACSMIGSFEPDALILDLNLPDMNGVDVLKFIHSHEVYSKIKVILNSSLDSKDDLFQKAHTFPIMANMGKSKEKDYIIYTLNKLNSIKHEEEVNWDTWL